MSALGVIRAAALWPRDEEIKADIGCWGAIGRAIHWSAAAFASNILVAGSVAAVLDPTIDPVATLALVILLAAILYLPGRGLRKAMAGE